MSVLSDSVAAHREAFVDDLCAHGFRLLTDRRTLVGDIDVEGKPVEHQIVLTEDFPVTKPVVSTPGGEGGLSWHRESNGRFCLWSDDDAADLPWSSADAVIDRIMQWHAHDAAGWPDDQPDLDLERYWPSIDELVIYPDLAPLTGEPCKAKRGNHDVWEIAQGKAPPKKPRWAGAAVVDVGELNEPVRSFDELAEVLGSGEAETLRLAIERGRLRFLMVRYRRQGSEAALALIARGKNTNRLFAAGAAHAGTSTYLLRAGLDAEALRVTSVAIVGVGAVGSVLAEMLSRSGVGRLTLVDHDRVRPGNCIRHVATRRDIGRAKTEAVKQHLVESGVIAKDAVASRYQALTAVSDTEDLFANHDLVIDATGNGPATALVLTASRILDKPAITVCLQRSGSVARVDRFPLREGEQHDPPLPPGGPSLVLREGGCGDPVSPTPPWACAAAAARAAGMAADLLSGRRMYPPTVIDGLMGQSDGPPISPSRR